MWVGRHVVVGVTGGIACYKSCYLVRRLTEAGAKVDVVVTRGAAEFVSPLTFEALSGRSVLGSLWEPDRALAHVRLGQEADLLIVAPATAHFIARVANGFADDFLTAMLLARAKPALFAPAMNDEMFAASATQANLDRLRAQGVAIVGPDSGGLAEGPSDRPGRMSEPEVIFRHAHRLLGARPPFAGRRVVVTAGPTRETLDPVRVMTNRSSGKMGFRLAEAAWYRGADVHLITGPTGEPDPPGITVERVESTAELESAVRRALPNADLLIMAAAPADYRPTTALDHKRPRQDGPFTVGLEATVDVLVATRTARKAGAVIVGFALETGDAIAKATAKLARKDLDFIIVNDALDPGAGFEVDTNRVTLLEAGGGRHEIPFGTKAEVSEAILDRVEVRLDDLTARYLRQQIELGGREVVTTGRADRRTGGQADRSTLAQDPLSDQSVTAAGPLPDRPPPKNWRIGAPPIPGPGLTIPAPAIDLLSPEGAAWGSLEAVATDIAGCRKCFLCEGRTKVVPGEGNPRAELVLVGEGPGQTEDQTGRPFVGRAGELLTGILAAIGLAREQVFICNVVKCRPPQNRKPLPEEMAACSRYLEAQLGLIRPKAILALGATAAEALLQTKRSLADLRGKVHSYRGTPLVVTYHPAALLRNPNWKKPTWDDVRIARQLIDR